MKKGFIKSALIFCMILTVFFIIKLELTPQSQDIINLNSSITYRIEMNGGTNPISFEASAIVAVNGCYVDPGYLKVELNNRRMPWKHGGLYKIPESPVNSIIEKHKIIIEQRTSNNTGQYETLVSVRGMIKPVTILSPKPGYIHRFFEQDSKRSGNKDIIISWTPSLDRFKIRLFKRGGRNPGMVKVWGPQKGNSVKIPISLLNKNSRYHIEILQFASNVQIAGNVTENSLFLISIRYMTLFETK